MHTCQNVSAYSAFFLVLCTVNVFKKQIEIFCRVDLPSLKDRGCLPCRTTLLRISLHAGAA